MAWTGHFYIACAIIAATAFLSLPGGEKRFRLLGLKRKPDLSPLHFCMIGVYLSAVARLLPVYLQDLAEEADHSVRAVISSLHQAFQMFTLDADRDTRIGELQGLHWKKALRSAGKRNFSRKSDFWIRTG